MRRARGLGVALRCVAFELACTADDDGTGTTTTRSLAEALEVTERTAERWLVDLGKAGWFERSGRKAWRLRIPDRRIGIDPDTTIGIGAAEPDAGVGTSGASRASDSSGSQRFPKTKTKIRSEGGAGETHPRGAQPETKNGFSDPDEFRRVANARADHRKWLVEFGATGGLGPMGRLYAREGDIAGLQKLWAKRLEEEPQRETG